MCGWHDVVMVIRESSVVSFLPCLKVTKQMKEHALSFLNDFYQPERAQRANGWYYKIALRFPRLFVCLSVCLCVRTYHVRNILRHTLLCNCSV